MRQNLLGFAHLFVLLILALIVFTGIGYYAYKNGQIRFNLQQEQFTTSPAPTANLSRDEVLRDWKTYTNIKYGIEFKYLSYLSYVEQGPNLFQQELDKGKQISGTVEPSLENVIFKDQKNATQFVLGIFQINLKDLSVNDYLNNFLYTRGRCDILWGFEPTTTSIMDLSNPKVLKVAGKKPGFQNCYYLTNQSGYLYVLSTEVYNNQAAFQTLESSLEQILSTFQFTE